MADSEQDPMDRETTGKAVEWLSRRDGGDPMVCPLCKTTGWTVLTPGELPLGGGSNYPLIPLICKTCGLTMFFHTSILDRLDSELDEEAQAAMEQADLESKDRAKSE